MLGGAKKSFSKIKYYTRKGMITILYLLLIVGIIYVLLLNNFKTNSNLINYIVFVIFMFLIMFMLDVIFFNANTTKILDIVFDNKKFRILLIFFIIFTSLIFPSLFHYRFYVPSNLENLDNLDKYGQNKNAKLKYFNDKYIFIEHKKEDNSTSIQVVPFEELFDSK